MGNISEIYCNPPTVCGICSTLCLAFFRLDNGKEQPCLSPCRISAITHTLETEFMPVAVKKGCPCP